MANNLNSSGLTLGIGSATEIINLNSDKKVYLSGSQYGSKTIGSMGIRLGSSSVPLPSISLYGTKELFASFGKVFNNQIPVTLPSEGTYLYWMRTGVSIKTSNNVDYNADSIVVPSYSSWTRASGGVTIRSGGSSYTQVYVIYTRIQ